MTAQGFLNQRRRHPVAMTAALSINIGAVALLMLAKSHYVPKIPEPTWVRHIPLPKPPPLEPIRKEPRAKSNTPTQAEPRPLPPEPDATRDPYPEDDVILSNGGGGGVGTTRTAEPDPIPTPKPVMVAATPLASAARDFQPPYPTPLLRTGVEGKAVVRVLIGADGRVKQVAIISTDDPLFADATERQALRKWRFRPATRDGVPVESWKQLTVRFEIRS